METKPKQNPAVGGLGCLSIVLGVVLLFASANTPGIILLLAGIGVLVYALATGKVKTLG